MITWEYLATTTGAVAVTILVTNAIRLAFGFSAAWVALAVAFLTQLAVWFFVAGGTADAAGIALFNTFVVYTAATGGNALVNSAVRTRHTTRAASGPGFWDGWV